MQTLTISWFETAFPPPKTPAFGTCEKLSWNKFCEIMQSRREGEKDGPGFVPARFSPESHGNVVRRKKANLLARTAVVLDVETNKKTGEIPPAPEQMAETIRDNKLSAVVYTSHSHLVHSPRYRVVFPISDEISVDIPAPEIMARRLNLYGVVDHGKEGAASFFYCPSCKDEEDEHYTEVINGLPIKADEITAEGKIILAAEQAERDKIAEESHRLAAQRVADRIASGLNPDDSLIDKLRSHLDLESILLAHGYAKAGVNFRHPNSSSGCFGANIKNFGGIDRIFSHNATDPLHASNLPLWCGKVTALDAFDVAAILDYNGNRKEAMIKLAEKFNLTKARERKHLCRLMFQLIRRQAPQDEIERTSFEEGLRLGFSQEEICNIAKWVVAQAVEARP